MSQPNWWAFAPGAASAEGTRLPGDRMRASIIDLDESERQWVKRKWMTIRDSQVKADKANLEWQAQNESLNSYLDAKGETDPILRTRTKSDNIALKDALETGKWHAANAQRHIDDVMLFLKLKELGLL